MDFLRADERDGTSALLQPEQVLEKYVKEFERLVFHEAPIRNPTKVRNFYALIRMIIGPAHHLDGLKSLLALISLSSSAVGGTTRPFVMECLAPKTADTWLTNHFPDVDFSDPL